MSQANNNSHQLIVIDSRVNDSQSLINSINIDAALLILDPLRDGLEQIASALNSVAELDAIQIISHGSPGSLQLGASIINNSNLSQYSNQLALIGSALKKDGDILLYGCDIAQGETGTDFISQLANLTGADVAASVDLTGSSAHGGNWALEKQTGAIETSVIQPESFTGVLEVNSAPSFITQGTGIVADKNDGVHGSSIAIQLNEKIFVFAGNYVDFYRQRYNMDGSLDVTKSNDNFKGYSFPFFTASSVGPKIIKQDDGNILVMDGDNYFYGFYVAQLNQNGKLDNVLKFPPNSLPEWPLYAAVQSDGKFLTSAFVPDFNRVNGFELHRYNSDGSLDVNFGKNGTTSIVFSFTSTISHDYQNTYQNMVVQSDGKILVAGDVGSRNFDTNGEEIALVRYNADGTLDTGFSDQGIAFLSHFKLGKTNCLTVQADGKILVAGLTLGIAYPEYSAKYGFEHDFAVCRFNSDGTLDTSFGTQGYARIDFDKNNDYVYSLKLQTDGQILLAGNSVVLNDIAPQDSYESMIALVRLNQDGHLDSSFSSDGLLTTSLGGASVASSIDIQDDGKILVSGLSNSYYPNWYGRLEGDTLALVRYNEDGTLDTSFNALNTLGNTVEYSKGASVILAPKANIRDTELDALNNYAGATLTLLRHGGANIEDQFTDSGTLVFNNGIVNLEGASVGSYLQNNGELTIVFNGNATSNAVDSVMQQIAYTNSTGVLTRNAQIDWQFSDGSYDQAGTQTTVGSSFIQQYRNDLITYKSINMETAFNWMAPKIYVSIDSWIVSVFAGQHQLIFMGDFTVNSASRSLSGTVTDIIYHSNSVDPAYEFHGLNLSAGKISYFVLNYNLAGLKSYLFSGNERFTGLEGADVFNGYAGSDELLGNAGNDKLYGGSGDDLLDGGTGADIMAGGAGNDFYLVDNIKDVVTETTTSPSQIDEVQSSVSFTLKANVENLTLTGTDAIDVTGNASKNLLIGNTAANILNGAAGADRMIGNLGNDTYFVDNVGDVIIETSALDTETEQVYSTITYALGDNLENLSLLGKKAINGTGNALENLIVGNKANNIINGGAGADTLTGGLGADKFVFAAVTDSGPTSLDRDVITDFNASQKDKINVSAIDADTAADGKQSFVLTQGGAFSGSFSKVGELFFDSIDHILYGNNDADLEADFSIQLSGVNSLTITDFVM
jgi:uncharacterized delta-60 repeat protein